MHSTRPPSRKASAGHAERRTRVRVRYADTDQMGVVYHSNYLVWFEVGRTEWLREGGWSYRELEAEGFTLPVIEVHCQYHQPARYDDELDILTAVSVMTPVRVRFDYQARRTGDNRLAATGYTIHAAVGPDGRPRRLPGRVLEMLA